MEHLPIALADFNNKNNIPWVLEDPHLCITLKKWLPLLDGAPPAIIFTFCHPMDVATSLLRCKSVSHLYEALQLWISWHRIGGMGNEDGLK